MNKKGHVLNAVLLALGLGIILEPSLTMATAERTAQIFVPIVLGALFPDVDTAFGEHRKTLHNFLTIGVFVAYPLVFDNLHFVWIGVLTHYVLDLLGSKRGLALFYPWEEEFALPVGVSTSSRLAGVVTIAVTVVELGLLVVAQYYIPVIDLETDIAQAANAIGTAFGL